MAGQERKLRNQDIQGLKYFRSLEPLLARLHAVGTERDKAGNRSLHMDEYCTLLLIWLFSPLVDSLRGLQQASELDKVRKKFGVGRASLGSLSESVRLFDPEPLRQIAAELSHQVPGPEPSRFDVVGQSITAVDGSVIDTVVQVARLAWLPKANGKSLSAYRLHTHFEVLRGVPARIDVTPAKPQGEADERAVLERSIEPDRCYVIDRGYAKFTLWNAIHQVGSSYVCRVRDNSAYEVEQTNLLSAEDVAAGVLRDEVVILGKSSKEEARPDHPLRLVTIAATQHTSRGKYRGGSTGPGCDGTLRLVTNRLDLPAELVSEMYRLRWLIELFFRMFKQLLGCRHLLSTKEQGVELQAYCAIIACLLILIHTGRSPTKRTFEMISFYLVGWASLEELERHIEKLPAAK
jgi:IS4 transposase